MENSHVHRIVLHIEDDAEDRQLVKDALIAKNDAFIVKEVEDGKSAIGYLKVSKVAGMKPCLIILDLNMPDMDGKAVVEQIREDKELSQIPIVILTTSTNETDKLFAKKEGIEFITKPLTVSQVTEVIDKILALC